MGAATVAEPAQARVTFEKVHCVHDTRGEWGRDEIYLATFPTVVRREGGRHELRGYLSTIQGGVRSGTVYVPSPAMVEIDVSDATELFLPIALYEADQRNHYQRLQRDPKFANVTPSAGWGDVLDEIQRLVENTKSKAWTEVVFGAFRIVLGAIRAISQDDMIDLRPITVPLLDEYAPGPREYIFKGLGSEYRIGFRLELA